MASDNSRSSGQKVRYSGNDKPRPLFDNAPVAYFTLTSEGIINKVNNLGAELLGLKKSELINKVFSQFILNQDLKKFKLCRVNLIESRRNQSCEARIFRSDGSIVFSRFDFSIVRIGDIDEILVVLFDISYHKQIEDTQSFLLGNSWSDRSRDFFQILVKYLAETLIADYVCIDQLLDNVRAENIAVYSNGHLDDNIRYTLKDTPCGKISGARVCTFPSNVRYLFPKDKVLQDLEAESYVGITLWGTNGSRIGHIAVISRKPLASTIVAETILKQVSIRAAAELEFRLLIRKVNRTFTALEKCSLAVQNAFDEKSLLNKVCQIIVDDCGFAMVWIGYAERNEPKSITPVASAGFEKGYLETLNLTWADEERGRGPTGYTIRTGEINMCRNMLTDPKFKPWREEAKKRGYASSIVFPLSSNDKTFGAVSIYSREADPFKEDEIRLLAKLTNDLAQGIAALRLRR